MNSMQRFSRLDGGEKQVCSPTKLSFNKCNTALKQAWCTQKYSYILRN